MFNPVQNLDPLTDAAKKAVARRAEQPANAARFVAMVDEQVCAGIFEAADGANAALPFSR